MKKVYLQPRTEDLDFYGAYLMAPGSGDTPLEPGVGAPERITRMYI